VSSIFLAKITVSRDHGNCTVQKIGRSQSGRQTAHRTYAHFVPGRNIPIYTAVNTLIGKIQKERTKSTTQRWWAFGLFERRRGTFSTNPQLKHVCLYSIHMGNCLEEWEMATESSPGGFSAHTRQWLDLPTLCDRSSAISSSHGDFCTLYWLLYSTYW